MSDALLLNADYAPVRILPWERAVCLLLSEKVLLVAAYADRAIRSPTLTLPWPAVVQLKGYVGGQGRVRFNRSNVLARDAYTCQYCGWQPRARDGRPITGALTLDHVVPRAQARDGVVVLPWNGRRVAVTGWENVVASCRDCNRRKAARTPDQAGMRLLASPKRPGPWDAVRIAFARTRIPEEWQEFLPDGFDDRIVPVSAWR